MPSATLRIAREAKKELLELRTDADLSQETARSTDLREAYRRIAPARERLRASERVLARCESDLREAMERDPENTADEKKQLARLLRVPNVHAEPPQDAVMAASRPCLIKAFAQRIPTDDGAVSLRVTAAVREHTPAEPFCFPATVTIEKAERGNPQ